MKKILMVEDSLDDQILTRKAIKKTGIKCDLQIVSNGIEALEYIGNLKLNRQTKTQNENPNLIIIDLKLPKISGLELLCEFRKIDVLKQTPIVVFSTSKEESDLSNAYRLKANSYVRKPVGFSHFKHIFCSIVDYWLNVNEVPEPLGEVK